MILPILGYGSPVLKKVATDISPQYPNLNELISNMWDTMYAAKEAVLGANVVLTASTKIIDVTGESPVEFKGNIPVRSVVIPGSYNKSFKSGSYQVPCALIIGKRKESTNKKTSLNEALREHNVSA